MMGMFKANEGIGQCIHWTKYVHISLSVLTSYVHQVVREANHKTSKSCRSGCQVTSHNNIIPPIKVFYFSPMDILIRTYRHNSLFLINMLWFANFTWRFHVDYFHVSIFLNICAGIDENTFDCNYIQSIQVIVHLKM